MTAIWHREWKGYFHTPVGYVFMGVFLLLSGILFDAQILQTRSGDLLTLIGQMSYLWMLLCPVLTMRLMSEERQKHTEELLLSSPVSLPGIVMGKYLAAVSVQMLSVLLTLVYVLIVHMYGTVYPGEVMTGYIGFLLQGWAFIALDLFMASLTASQVTAFLAAFGANLILWMVDMVSANASEMIRSILNFFSLYMRNEPFLMGQLSFASILFDVCTALFFLILTVFWMDRRRRRGA